MHTGTLQDAVVSMGLSISAKQQAEVRSDSIGEHVIILEDGKMGKCVEWEFTLLHILMCFQKFHNSCQHVCMNLHMLEHTHARTHVHMHTPYLLA